VRGGERPNVVAEGPFAEIDLRAWTREEADAAIATMRATAAFLDGGSGQEERGLLGLH
jgi:hypothetical protein